MNTWKMSKLTEDQKRRLERSISLIQIFLPDIKTPEKTILKIEKIGNDLAIKYLDKTKTEEPTKIVE